jgi:hypothetical protein
MLNLKSRNNNNKNKKEQPFYRQGDVLLRKMGTRFTPNKDLPNGVLPANTNIVAEGEATGHNHTLRGGSAQLLVDPKKQSETYLVVEQETQLVHQEHKELTNQRTGELEAIQPGSYVVVKEREWDYTEEAFRQVRD